ncbi:MAG: flavoprotein [Bauldia sp.]
MSEVGAAADAPLAGRRLLIAITGAVAAIGVPRFLLSLRTEGATVRVVSTPHGDQFLPIGSMSVFSGGPSRRTMRSLTTPGTAMPGQGHDAADVVVVLPATANILGKAALGLADDAVSAAIAMSARPVVFVPAMNDAMWTNGRVERNARTLRNAGHVIVEPGPGMEVADLRPTLGALASFTRIRQAILDALRLPSPAQVSQ